MRLKHSDIAKIERKKVENSVFTFGRDTENIEFISLIGSENLEEIRFETAQPNLKYMDASRCNIKKIIFSQPCPNLKVVSLNHNQLVDFAIGVSLPSLELLDLSFNEQLTSLNISGELPKLNFLYLHKCNLKDLSYFTDHFASPKFDFNIEDNEGLQSPPVEIVKQGKGAVISYFTQIANEGGKVEYLFETKVLIIGEGGTGKTSFAVKMKGPSNSLPKDEDTTLGIEVSKWNFEIEHLLRGNQTMFTNLWDFGGQKLYQGTHQIFFSVKSFYVLLAASREDSTDFAYWLNTVEQLAGTESKLLIVANIKHGHKPQIDTNGLKGRFGDMIAGIFEVDLEKDQPRTRELQNELIHLLPKLSGIGDPLPPSWKKIREELSTIEENYISRDRYLEICRKNKTNMDELDVLNEYFNRIGVFTYYFDDPILKQRVFLNSNWLLKTVYSVLNADTVKLRKGRITHCQLNPLWCNDDTRLETDYLSRLMHRLGLMYEIEGKDIFIIPSHLSIEQPYETWAFENKPDILQFCYEFDKYMPRGIMPRLIVALHPYIHNNERVWKSGFNIAMDRGKTCAEIKESYEKPDTFQIRIHGADKKECKGVIVNELNKILEPYKKLNYEITVPCICGECNNKKEKHFFKLSTLKNLKSKFKLPSPAQAQAQCENSGILVEVDSLLEGFEMNSAQGKETETSALIIKGKISEAIERLLHETEGKPNLHKKVSELSARWNHNEGDRNKNIISVDAHNIETARMIALLTDYQEDNVNTKVEKASQHIDNQVITKPSFWKRYFKF